MEEQKSKKMLIASRIKQARKMAGLSQGQVAKKLSMHRPTISEIEAGRRNVSAEELIKFAEIYDVNITWLACENVEESDEERDRVELAARELNKLKPEDLERVLNLIKAVRKDK